MDIPAQEKTLEIRVPFAGFYCTVHDQVFDTELEQINEDQERIGLHNVEWAAVHLAYAQKFLSKLSDALGIEMSFTRLSSPKFYNFETDQIFARVPASALESLHDRIMSDPEAAESLRQHVLDRLTPKPGWAPYYPADLSDWGQISGWDEAQMSLLVDFEYARCDVDDYQIAEELSEVAHNLIWDHVIDPSIVPGHVDGPEESPSP